MASEADVRSSPDERWVRLERSPHLPEEVADLLFCYVQDGGHLACRGVHLRTEGAPTGTLMRDLQLASLEAEARSAAGLLLAQRPRVTADPGAGRGGHPPEFLRQIRALHLYAIDRHPRRPVAWMHEEGLPERLRPQSVETVRTWTRQAKALAETSTKEDSP